MPMPDGSPAAIYRDSRDRASLEIDLLTGVARLRAAQNGEHQAAAEISGMIGRLDHQELAGLLTAAIMRLAQGADFAHARPS